MAVRMKDIARAIGVSTVTVSKVLNNDPTISVATRDRVLACAKELNYRKNQAALGLATGKSNMVGLIVPEIVHGFFSEVAAGVSDFLRGHGYGLIISSSRDDSALEAEEIRQMLARRVDAVILASCANDPAALEALIKELPVVFLDRRTDLSTSKTGFVGTDDFLAGELATRHLLAAGCTRVAYIGGPQFSPTMDREISFRSVHQQHGIRVQETLVVHLPQNEEATHTLGSDAMRKLLRLASRPDAVFCYNDAAAYGAMHAILEANLRIPDDIALVGCGNNRYDEFLRIPLSSVDQNTAQLGLEAARLALALIHGRRAGDDPSERLVIVKPTLVQRQSTRRNKGSVSRD